MQGFGGTQELLVDFFARVGRIGVISVFTVRPLNPTSLHPFTHEYLLPRVFGQDPRCAALAKSHTSRVEALSLKRPTCPEV